MRWTLLNNVLRLATNSLAPTALCGRLLDTIIDALNSDTQFARYSSEIGTSLSFALGVRACVAPQCAPERITSLMNRLIELLKDTIAATPTAAAATTTTFVASALPMCVVALRRRLTSDRLRVKLCIETLFPIVIEAHMAIASADNAAGVSICLALLSRLVADVVFDTGLLAASASADKKDSSIGTILEFIRAQRSLASNDDGDDRRSAALSFLVPLLFSAVVLPQTERDVPSAYESMQAFEHETPLSAAVRARQQTLQQHATRVNQWLLRLWAALVDDNNDDDEQRELSVHAIEALSALLRRLLLCGSYVPGTSLDSTLERVARVASHSASLPIACVASFHSALLALNVRMVLLHRRSLFARLWSSPTVNWRICLFVRTE